MMEHPNPDKPLWLRVLQFPLVRLILLGPLLFLMAGISNGFWEVTFADRPLIGIATTVLMVALGIAVYFAFVKFIEQRVGRVSEA